jgi:hypothetical protein
MLCKNCGINEREEPFGWCSMCLDAPPLDKQPKKGRFILNAKDTGGVWREALREALTPIPLPETKKHHRVDRGKSRAAWRRAYKRPIPRGWHIHHLDGNPENNDPNNLVCVSLEQHINLHDANGDTLAVRLLKRGFKK